MAPRVRVTDQIGELALERHYPTRTKAEDCSTSRSRARRHAVVVVLQTLGM
jgi:hypothetical protein